MNGTITDINQCFNLANVQKYINSLNFSMQTVDEELMKIEDKSDFGKKAFYVNDKAIVKEKIQESETKTISLKEKIKVLKNIIYQKAYDQRIEDLNSYITYINTEIEKEKESIRLAQVVLDRHKNIKTLDDFGVETRYNASTITEWHSNKIRKDNALTAITELEAKIKIARAEIDSAKAGLSILTEGESYGK